MKKLFSVVLAAVLGLSLSLQAQDDKAKDDKSKDKAEAKDKEIKDKEVKDKEAAKSSEQRTVYHVNYYYTDYWGYMLNEHQLPFYFTVLIVAILVIWYFFVRKKTEGADGSPPS